MKLLIFGPANSGKTSLLKTAMENSSFISVENLPPTRGIVRETYLFRGLLEISAWDAGGQQKYQDRYYGSQEENVFSSVDLPIYMVDAVTVDDTVRPAFDKFVNKVLEKNPGLNMIYVFINKIDLPDAKEEKVHELLTKDLPADLHKKLSFTPVSVKQGSAQQRLVAICDQLIEKRIENMGKLNKLRGIIEEFKGFANGADFLLFNKRDGLMITSTLGKFSTQSLQFITFQISALESNVHEIYARTMELRNNKVTPLSLNTIVMESSTNFVLAKEVEEKATLMAITRDKKLESVQKVVEVISDTNPIYEKLINVLEFANL
ncbi:MAG: ADP-ribosylation factor-like protein [Candidatus Sigynarchaeota archaeon]